MRMRSGSSSLIHQVPLLRDACYPVHITLWGEAYGSLCKTADGHDCQAIPCGCSLPGILLPSRLHVEKTGQSVLCFQTPRPLCSSHIVSQARGSLVSESSLYSFFVPGYSFSILNSLSFPFFSNQAQAFRHKRLRQILSTWQTVTVSGAWWWQKVDSNGVRGGMRKKKLRVKETWLNSSAGKKEGPIMMGKLKVREGGDDWGSRVQEEWEGAQGWSWWVFQAKAQKQDLQEGGQRYKLPVLR